MEFKKVTLGEIDVLRTRLQFAESNICDFSVGGIVMWRDFFCTEYAIVNDTLLFKYLVTAAGQKRYMFSYPVGPDAAGALSAVAEYCDVEEIPLSFCTITDEELEVLSRRYPRLDAVPERDWFDYLYLSDDLMNLAGRRYAGQRNHINKFVRSYPDWSFDDITQAGIPEIIAFLNEYYETETLGDAIVAEEKSKTFELFENYAAYGLMGAVLRAGKKIAAVSVGEVVGETLFVHIEKAKKSYSGVYAMITNQFAKRFGGGVKYINREEDVGDEGLRTAKLAYHPYKLLSKYTVLVK